MAGEIWVLVEQWRGRISDITYEVLALGREGAGPPVPPRCPPAVCGIPPGGRPPEQGRVGRAPAVRALSVDLPTEFPLRFRGYTEPEAGDVDITRENVLVAVGRGIQRPENVALAEELAAALGGAVCGS